MMKRATLLAVVSFLGLCGTAAASDPYQSWFAAARAPLPHRVTIWTESCPGVPFAESCASPTGHAIYIVRPHGYPASWRRHFFLHEIGHELDFQRLTPRRRRHFLRLVHLRTWGTGGEARTGIEWFAEAYSFCAYPATSAAASYGYRPRAGACRWIRSL